MLGQRQTPWCLLQHVLFAFTAVLLAPSSFSYACVDWHDELTQSDLVIGAIQIDVKDVFDHDRADENQLIHRLANRLHIESRKNLIEAQLLFASGQAFDPDLLRETARNLRARRYLRSARVVPVRVCEGRVDILVTTGDNWSLIPGFNFSRAGGENQFTFSFSELNLLGQGKSLAVELEYGPDRDQQVLLYEDPMLFGSTTQFNTQLQNNSDGEVQLFEFSQAFTSLDTRSSWGVKLGHVEYVQGLYDAGRLSHRLGVDREFGSLHKGFSTGRKLAYTHASGQRVYRVTRARIGWQYENLQLSGSANRSLNNSPNNSLNGSLESSLYHSLESSFDNARNRLSNSSTASSLGSTPNSAPDNAADANAEDTHSPIRRFSYPFIEVDWLQPEFIEQTNLQLMESVEDIDIGHRLRTRIGWASTAFGSSRNAMITEMEYTKGWQNGERWLTLFDASAEGHVSDAGINNGIAKANLKSYFFANRRTRLFGAVNVITSAKLFEHRQVVLGGATGLRGYPLYYQTGSRRARLTLEHRYFFDWYPWRLARIGTATFADVGAAWDKGDTSNWLSDVGVGLRVVGTRQAEAKVLHIDLAVPLNTSDNIERVQLVVSAKSQF